MRSVPSLLLEDHCGSEMRHRLQVTKPEVGGPVGKQRNNSGERRWWLGPEQEQVMERS